MSDKQFRDRFNLVCDRTTLQVAWQRIRANRGSRTTGVDGMTRADVEDRIGVGRFLGELRVSLKDGSYRPQPVRERSIPKPGTRKVRRVGISTLLDRVVQMALKLVLEPIFEPDQYQSSYAYRPGRRAQDAVAEIVHAINNGYEWVIEGDLEAYFDRIDHKALLAKLNTVPFVRRAIRGWLKAGVLDGARFSPTTEGTPQGGSISALLMNVALHGLETAIRAAFPSRVTRGGKAILPWQPIMAGHPSATMDDLDNVGGGTHLDRLPRQPVRHRVIAGVELHMLIDVQPRRFPRGELVAGGWQ